MISVEKFKIPDINKEYSITKTFRLKYVLIEKLELISKEHNISMNRLVTECVEYALKNLEFKTLEKK